MKNIFKILLVSALVFTSCNKDDVLDKKPLSIISELDVWSDAALADAYLTQAYSETYVFTLECPSYGKRAGQGFKNWAMGETGTGYATIMAISDEGMDPGWVPGTQEKLGNLTVESTMLEWWDNAYKVIRICNEVIENMPNLPRDEEINNQRIAEARWIRAFNYFSMVKRYGGVPLITKSQTLTDPENELYPVRATEREIYDFVIKETDEILADLPDVAVHTGRVSKWAALALKSRAALYAGSIAKYGTVQLDGILGIESSLAAGYFEKSYTASNELIQNGNHSLYELDADKVTNFRNLFLVKDNSEAIFVKKHNGVSTVWSSCDGNGWSWDFFQSPCTTGWTYGNMNKPYLEMAEAFELADGTPGTLDRDELQQGLWTPQELWANKEPRFFASIYWQGTLWSNPANEDGDTVKVYRSLILPDGSTITGGSYNGVYAQAHRSYNWNYGTTFGVLKYCDEKNDNLQSEWSNSTTDFMVFRLGEIYLNYAEAALELGHTSEALTAINTIRNRAGIAPRSSLDMDMIRHERRIELAFEGHRYWDLRRWRIATTALSRDFTGLDVALDYTTRRLKIDLIEKFDGQTVSPAFHSHNYYLPIGLTRTSQNTNLVENPGY